MLHMFFEIGLLFVQVVTHQTVKNCTYEQKLILFKNSGANLYYTEV